MNHSNPQTKLSTDESLAAFVGLDWADDKHAVVLLAAGSQTQEHATLEHTPEALSDWVAQLHQRFPGGKIAIILEQSRGSLLYALLAHAHLVLYPINPQMAAQFRKAFYPSGAKTDPLDADLLLQILLQHRDRLKAWQPDEPVTRQLQLLVEARRRFVADRVRLSNRLENALKSYFPQALQLVGESLTTPMACAFLQKWPTLEAVQKAGAQRLRKFYYGQHSRAEDRIQQRLRLLAQAKPLTTDTAVVSAQSLLVKSVARELAALPGILAEYDQQIATLFSAHADSGIWDSFPGAGPALAPRLAAAWGTQRDRFESGNAMAAYSGIAPVKQASGRSVWIHMRWACPKFLRQTFHELARTSLSFCIWAQCYYQMQLQRGKGRHAAFRALAFKWQRIMWRCWQDRVPYDDSKYVESLKRDNNELYARVIAFQSAPNGA
jgi:transposase